MPSRLFPDTSVQPEFSLTQLSILFGSLTSAYDRITVDMEQVMRIHSAVEWLLGGPMAPAIATRVRTDHALLYRVCSADATRELWGGEAFWSEYRRRFDPGSGGGAGWSHYLEDPKHRLLLFYAPTAAGR